MESLVYIILINYNGFEDTVACLKSIEKSNYKNYKVLIIDNNSPDDSGNKLKKLFPQYEFIMSSENLGFAEANNIGYKYAIANKAEYVLLLNNDTVIHEDMISKLVFNSHPNTVTIPKMFYYDLPDTIWFAGGEILESKATVRHIGEGKKDSEFFCKEKYVSFATGCCILIPVSILNQIGLFNKDYFMYCEDFEFSINLAEHNYSILYCPDAKLWHKVNASTRGNSNISKYYLTRNRFYIYSKNKKFFKKSAIIYIYITRIILIIKDLLSLKSPYIYILAWWDYVSKNMGRKDFK